MNEKKYIDRDAVLDLVEKALMKADKSARDTIATLGNVIAELPAVKEAKDKISELSKVNEFGLEIEVMEPNMFGEYTGDSYFYKKSSTKPIKEIDIEDLLFQICEIEQIYCGKILVGITKTYNGEYMDSDESEFIVSVLLTDELTPFVKWNDELIASHPIYKIDRANSNIKAID